MTAPSEQVFLKAHPSRLFSFGLYAAATLLFFVAIGLTVNRFLRLVDIPVTPLGPLMLETWLIIGFVVLALVLIFAAEIRRLATTYTITDSRIVRKGGIVSTTTDSVPYRQIERVEMRQTVLQRAVGVGTVAVDTGDDLVLIEHVSKPDVFERTINQRISLYR